MRFFHHLKFRRLSVTRMNLSVAPCLVLCLALLPGCANNHSPVVIERSLSGVNSAAHTVLAGETLYSIALRYDKDYRELAQLNRLDPLFTIHPGQRLLLNRGAVRAASISPLKTGKSPTKRVVQKPDKEPALKPLTEANKSLVVKKDATVSTNAELVSALHHISTSLPWVWPALGPLVGVFGAQGVAGKGLDIGGRRGDSVCAAAAGTVVYAGAGLVGYGRMLIVRHDDNYISAYAYNDRFLVKEGDRVTAGQAVAVMGSTGTDQERLHFEIRERGKPVDPLRFLPAR